MHRLVEDRKPEKEMEKGLPLGKIENTPQIYFEVRILKMKSELATHFS